MSAARIGLYGGTFSPPHMGHVHAASAVRDALALDRLLLIPDRLPPHKALPEGTPDEAHRLEMVRIAAESIEGAEVCDIELRLPPPSYTCRTAEAMRAAWPNAELWWIVGGDMLRTIHKWYEPARIFAACRIAALAREADELPVLQEQAGFLAREFGARVDLVRSPAVEVSSTALRGRLRAGERNIPELPRGVEAYILKEGLYDVRIPE